MKFKNIKNQAAGRPTNAEGDGENTNDPTNTALIVNAGSAKTKGVELDGFVRYEGFQFNYGLALFDGDIDLQPQPGLEGLLTTTHKFDRAPAASFTLGDRKSVVQGKSVSVRVDLGGRRIIKKKHESKISSIFRDHTISHR